MTEELDNSQEIKRKQTKKRESTEQYQYVPGENEELIMDRPSEPLNKIQLPNMKSEQKIAVKSNKELYESYLKELKNFSLSLNSEVIYDSSIDKSKESPLKFENDYFVLYGKKYSYNGLKIQKIN
jgi:hypothetical protein